MSEKRLRKLEKEYAQSPTSEAGAKLLLERVRAGIIPRHELQLLAHMGDAAARHALELPKKPAFAYETIALDGKGNVESVGDHELFEPTEGWARVASWKVKRYWLRALKVTSLKKPKHFREVAGVLLVRPNDAHFQSAAAFPDLRWLAARDGAKLSAKGLAHFSQHSLEALELSNCPAVTNPGEQDGSQLKTLMLLGSPVETLAGITTLEHLEEFSLTRTEFGADELRFLAKAKRLRTLNLSESPNLASLEFLSGLKHLETLDLSGAVGLDPSALEALSGLPKLRVLNLQDCLSVRNQIADLSLEHLEDLDLRPDGDRVPGLTGFLGRLPALRTLELSGRRRSYEFEEVLTLRRSLGRPDVEIDQVPTDSFHLAHSKNGRARCLLCGQVLAKGKIRASAQRFVAFREDEGELKLAYLHPLCAAEWYGTTPEQAMELYRGVNEPELFEEAFRHEPGAQADSAPEPVPLPSDEAVKAARAEVGPLQFCFERVESTLEGEFFRISILGMMARTASGTFGGEPQLAGNMGTFNQIAAPQVQRGFRLLGNLSEGVDMFERLQDTYRARKSGLGSYRLEPYAGEALVAENLLGAGLEIADPAHLEALAQDPLAPRVRALAVTAPTLFSVLEAVAARLPGLRVLQLPREVKDPARVLKLFPGLLHLETGACVQEWDPFAQPAVDPRLRSQTLRSLSLLDLTPRSALAFGESKLPALELLQLQADDPQDPALSESLPAARTLFVPQLRRLSLKSGKGTSSHAIDPLLVHLAGAAWLARLSSLDLVGGLTREGVPALETLAAGGIERIRLHEHPKKKWKRGTKTRFKDTLANVSWKK